MDEPIGQIDRRSEMSEALYLTQGFAYASAEEAEARFDGSDPGFVYARYGNPTVAMFEERLASLEGAEACFATASGMAAVNAAMFSQVSAGDHVVAARALFGSCHYIIDSLLPRFGVETTLVDGTDLDQWRAAMRENTRLCFLESPSNPMLEIIDIPAVAEIAHAAGARLVVDNVFATPCFQRPLELGADLVMYSTTKHIDGQGRCLGGALLGSAEIIRGPVLEYMKHTGAALSPFNAWVMLKGWRRKPTCSPIWIVAWRRSDESGWADRVHESPDPPILLGLCEARCRGRAKAVIHRLSGGCQPYDQQNRRDHGYRKPDHGQYARLLRAEQVDHVERQRDHRQEQPQSRFADIVQAAPRDGQLRDDQGQYGDLNKRDDGNNHVKQ